MNMSNFLALCIFASLVPFIACSGGGSGADNADEDETTFAMIASVGATGQWTIKSSISYDNITFYDNLCTSDAFGACFGPGFAYPFNQSVLVLGPAFIKIDYTFISDSLTLYESDTASVNEFKMCYSAVSYANQPWRKKNKAYPAVSNNCPFTMAKVPVPAFTADSNLSTVLSGSIIMPMTKLDNIPTSTLFFMIWTQCGDDTCAYETTETDTAVNTANYIQMQKYDPITTGMKVACGILSAFGPLFFVGYFIADRMHYNSAGKPLAW